MNILKIEDDYVDVLTKARWALRLSPEDLPRPTGVPAEKLASLFSGVWSEPEGRAVARTLGLREESVAALARGSWGPRPVPPVLGLRMFTVPYEDMTVNLYLAWSEATREAALFDTGPDAGEALKFVEENGLRLKFLFLTHTHRDHVMDVERVARETRCEVFVHHQEAMKGLQAFSAPRRFDLGDLAIEARHTWGHSFGGASYVVHGLAADFAIVGDALFAGSIGRPFVSYSGALGSIRSELFSLPHATVLCPGHGPLTSVGEELAFNPFFP